MEIPLPITLTGTVVGLIGSALFPWPWPDHLDDSAWWKQPSLHFTTATVGARLPRPALYPWPVWNELPNWMPLGSHLSGLAAGLAGVVAAMVILRGIAFLFKTGRGKEGLGLGDADLMMMVGSFLGWQAVVIAFFVSVGPALILGIAQLIFRGDRPFPFGPSLALGSILTMLGWNWFWQKMGPTLANFFFDGTVLTLTVSVVAVVMFVLFWMLGTVRGREPAPEPEKVMVPAPEPAVEEKVTTAEPPPP
jgi:leader peptidase (prepilin peptidase)/N-methyltransferase